VKIVLKAENLTLNVDDEGGKKCLLNNISFQVEDGEMLVITGPNGGGKSTLAKTLIGIQTPDSGKIILDGQDITELDINHRLMLAGDQLPMPLDVDLDIFIIIKDFEPQGFSKTAMDNLTSITTLENFDGRASQYALIQERLSVSFGKHMENLWHRYRRAKLRGRESTACEADNLLQSRWRIHTCIM
jgi:ABC-type cobalamin/Fe3+-siderophores transport system ATPase subunit